MPAGALERAVELLAALGDRPRDQTVAQLAGAAGMPTSTAYRLLGELEAHGLVARGADSTVALGARLVALGRSAEQGLRERLVAPAAPVMSQLCAAAGETAILTAPCALEALVLHVVETDAHPVRLSYALFRRGPLHLGASGKVLAAYLEPADRRRLIDAVGAEALDGQLAQIRASGFAFTDSELDPGAAAVAAPILDRRGRLVAGLSVAGPAQRVIEQRPALAHAVLAAAERIARTLRP
ncbi:MAG: IclR family transcriptional regulator [Solirubrobacteraceae bacterium]